MRLASVACCVLLFLVGEALSTACAFQSPSYACDYDFSPFVLPNPPYYGYREPNSHLWYDLNICEPVAGLNCTVTSPQAGACQLAGNVTSYNLGLVSQKFMDLPFETGMDCPGARVIYTNGSICPLSGQPRETTIDLVCSSSVTIPYIANITEESPCQYHVT